MEAKTGPRLIVTDGSNRFDLSDEIWIERLDEQLAKHIQKACEPPHYKINSVEHDRHLYAFVHRVPVVEKRKYAGIAGVFATIALSRLVHPTSIGDRYCSNVFHFGLPDSAIQAIQQTVVNAHVFIGNNRRDWLSVEDGNVLRKLMVWVPETKPMHPRVHRAYWNHEYATRCYYLDARWPLVVSGLEALINVEEDHVTRQFCQRALQLAKEFQINLT
jgi:hypothetical protein